MHKSIIQDIATLNRSKAIMRSDGSCERDSVVPYKGRCVLSVGIDEMDESVAQIVLGAVVA